MFRFLCCIVSLSIFLKHFSLTSTHIGSDREEPSKMSLAERIKLFNKKITADAITQKREIPKRRHTRFQTQPVTVEEVVTAQFMGSSMPIPQQQEIISSGSVLGVVLFIFCSLNL